MLCQFQKAHLHQLQKRYNLQYLRPPKQVYNKYIPQSQYFSDPTAKEPRRKIYYNVEYKANQLQIISEVKTQLQHHHFSQIISQELILKHAYVAKFDKEKIIHRIKEMVDHHNNPVITRFDDDTLRRLNTGAVYTYGMDRGYQPIVVLKIDRFNFQQSIQLLMNTYYYVMLVIYHYRMVPYHAEKMTFIVDFGRIPITSVPVFTLYEEMKKTGVCYCGVSQRMIVYNASSLGWIWKLISSFLAQNQKRKLIMIQKGQENKVLEYIEADQLEEQYGGNLTNLTDYWPPKQPKGSLTKKTQGTPSQSQYFSVNNDLQYFEISQKSNQKACCGGNCSCDIY